MKSIQTKFIALILGCVLLSATVIGGAGIITSQQVVDRDSAQVMNLMCNQEAQKLDALLSRIQQSVQTLAVYSLSQLDSLTRLKEDPVYLEEYTQKLQDVAVNAATNTEGAVAVYVRYNPEFTPPTSGLFWSKTALNGDFQPETPTDFSKFEAGDVERVGWYYLPVERGTPTWMSPYLNRNLNVWMISYVVPLYYGEETVGVVGMDIAFDVITESVSTIRAYDSGYAFLVDEQANIMYHRNLDFKIHMSVADASLSPVVAELKSGSSGDALYDYQWRGGEKRLAFRSLINGMCLAITAPAREIDAARNQLVLQICVAALGISTLALVLTVGMTRRIIRPLKELDRAAQKIADGDMSIHLTHQTMDEVGTLSDSFQKTVDHLQQYISYINGLAYRDALTGVKNKTAYQDAIQRLEEEMRRTRPRFGVLVMDINGLKHVNDHFGHDFGDMLILDCCKLISRTFKHSPVYRIGGDEFVVLLENAELEGYAQLLDELEENIKDHNRTARDGGLISIARGIALYEEETDLIYGNVFKRADDAMYANKAAMKARGDFPRALR